MSSVSPASNSGIGRAPLVANGGGAEADPPAQPVTPPQRAHVPHEARRPQEDLGPGAVKNAGDARQGHPAQVVARDVGDQVLARDLQRELSLDGEEPPPAAPEIVSADVQVSGHRARRPARERVAAQEPRHEPLERARPQVRVCVGADVDGREAGVLTALNLVLQERHRLLDRQRLAATARRTGEIDPLARDAGTRGYPGSELAVQGRSVIGPVDAHDDEQITGIAVLADAGDGRQHALELVALAQERGDHHHRRRRVLGPERRWPRRPPQRTPRQHRRQQDEVVPAQREEDRQRRDHRRRQSEPTERAQAPDDSLHDLSCCAGQLCDSAAGGEAGARMPGSGAGAAIASRRRTRSVLARASAGSLSASSRY